MAPFGPARRRLDALVSQAASEVLEAPESVSDLYRPFPVDALPEPLHSYVREVSRSLGCDPAFVVLPLLTVCASVLGNRFRIQLKPGWQEPPILWGVIIGESGTMKSPALKFAIEPLERLQAEAIERYQQQMAMFLEADAEYKRASEKFKKDSKGDLPEKPVQPKLKRYLISNITIEAAAEVLSENPNGVLLVRDELNGLFASFDRYSPGQRGGDVSQWLSMFNADSILVDRKTGPTPLTHVKSAAVCICGGIQPAVLHRALGQEHRENGFAARLLRVSPPRVPKTWQDKGVEPQAEATLYDLFLKLQNLTPEGHATGHEPFVILLDLAAKSLWVEFYNEHNKESASMEGELASAWAKLECYVPRFALIIWAIRYASGDTTLNRSTGIDADSMTAAIKIVRWFCQETVRVGRILGESDKDRTRRRLLEFIQARGGTISCPELTRGNRAYRELGAARTALDDLVRDGFGDWKQPPQQGRGRPPALRVVLRAGN